MFDVGVRPAPGDPWYTLVKYGHKCVFLREKKVWYVNFRKFPGKFSTDAFGHFNPVPPDVYRRKAL